MQTDMRNSKFLDQKQSEDSKIGEVLFDDHGTYLIINGKKIYQIEEKSQHDKDMNTIINRVRASGLSPWQYLQSKSK